MENYGAVEVANEGCAKCGACCPICAGIEQRALSYAMPEARYNKIGYYLRQYRKNLLKLVSLTMPLSCNIGAYERKLANLDRKARLWMKKAVKLGYDHATMLRMYHGALN
jgi:hypothetical protein